MQWLQWFWLKLWLHFYYVADMNHVTVEEEIFFQEEMPIILITSTELGIYIKGHHVGNMEPKAWRRTKRAHSTKFVYDLSWKR